MSIAGGLWHAFERGLDAGCDIVQIFTKSSQQWAARPLTTSDLETFERSRSESGIEPSLAHDSYLINLAAPGRPAWQKAYRAFADEVRRATRLRVPYLVTHPGAHMGRGDVAGIRLVAAALNRLHAELPDSATRVLLETTAGQGSSLGHRFEHLRDILALVNTPERVGVCIDTCHIFAAGYDIRTSRGWTETFATFERVVGCDKIRAFHVNDSRTELGSRVDRHAHLGRGFVGLGAFHALVNDRRFVGLPMALETPKENPHADRINLAILRALHGRKRLPPNARRLSEQSLKRPPLAARRA
jgi:deoxyribonuclease IV